MNKIKSKTIKLGPRLGYSAVENLLTSINEVSGSAISIDAAKVEHIGAPCLGLLLSARKTWQADGFGFYIDNPSSAFIAGINLLGIEFSEFSESGAVNAN